jgi:hypothetical protein
VIDAQSLSPGAQAGPFSGRRFRLDLDSPGGGVLRVHLNDHGGKIHSHQRASYVITANGISHTSYRGPQCP